MDLIAFESYNNAVGKEKARLLEKIIKTETPLVKSCVRRILGSARSALGANNNCETEDLIQVGLIALVSVIKKWDPAKGAWAAYARKWVTKAMYRALPEQTLIHVPVIDRPMLTLDQMAEVTAIRARTGREATAEEIGVSTELFAEWKTPPVRSTAVGDASDEIVQCTCSPDLTSDVLKALNTLDPRQQRIAMYLFVEEQTLDEVALIEGFSKFWVWEQKEEILKKLKYELTR